MGELAGPGQRRSIIVAILTAMQITGVIATALAVLLAAGAPAQAAPAASTPAQAAPPAGTTLVSVGSDGTPGDSGSGPASISRDGRYIAFASGATNLVPGDTNRDRDRAEPSGNGSRVLFLSAATDLATGAPPGYQNLYLRCVRSC